MNEQQKAEEAKLFEDVEADRRPGPKLVYADWLQDQAEAMAEAEARNLRRLAYALRWAASRALHPEITLRRRNASWRKQSRLFKDAPDQLPPCVFEALPAPWSRLSNPPGAQYKDVLSAFHALASALQDVRAAVEIGPVAW